MDQEFPDRVKLVLVAHDEMTAQAHDGEKMSWVWQGEQPLKKKGAGRGLHQSDFICSTVGWLKEASKTLEYGKNFDGFWNGELFVKQVHSFFFSESKIVYECNNSLKKTLFLHSRMLMDLAIRLW